MAVFVINAYDIHDFDTFNQYPPQVRPLLKKHGAKALAMQVNAKAVEGTPRTMNAIIEFPSEQAVTEFYNDPEYQKIIGLRHRSTSNCTMVMVNKIESNS
jgi:uncharacterized protein (DUF1330 family)